MGIPNPAPATNAHAALPPPAMQQDEETAGEITGEGDGRGQKG